MTISLTSELAHHIVGYGSERIEARGLIVGKQCILDWFGVALAGYNEPVAKVIRDEVLHWSRGPSTIVGSLHGAGPDAAALVNGATSHALDYDDVRVTVGHPTVAILPAVLAVAEERLCTGEQALRALVTGAEVAAIVGSWSHPSHYARGFHTTATVCCFGAAAAAGLLLGLDEQRMTMALGLAGTQAAGLKSMFGSMAKPFHAGKAASNGVLAARLAAAGVTSHPDVFGAKQGFLDTQCDAGIPSSLEAPQRGTEIAQTLFKYHAACYLTHSTMEAVRGIRESGVATSGISSIEVHVPEMHLSVCNILSPQTGLETKFSLRHTASLSALGYDTAAITTYSDEHAGKPDLVSMRERVVVIGDHSDGTSARVIVHHQGGRAEAEIDVGIPTTDFDEQERRLRAKFDSLVGDALGTLKTKALGDAIGTFERLDRISQLMAAAALPSGRG